MRDLYNEVKDCNSKICHLLDKRESKTTFMVLTLTGRKLLCEIIKITYAIIRMRIAQTKGQRDFWQDGRVGFSLP